MNKKEKSNILGSNDNRGTLFCGKLKGVKVSIIFKRRKGILNGFKLRKTKTQIKHGQQFKSNLHFSPAERERKKGNIQTFINIAIN